MTRKNRFGKVQSCTNYSSKDAFRNSILAGTAGATAGIIGTGVLGGVLANHYSKQALTKGLEKGCDIWSNNPSNYSDWLYPLSYYESVKDIVFDTLKRGVQNQQESNVLKRYESALYSVPEYDGILWGISKKVNPSGQLCNLSSYNLKHNLIEISQGNTNNDRLLSRDMKNLNKPEFKDLNNLVYKILNGKTKVKLSREFKKNMGFGSGGSILPYSGTDGIGGAYAQPSFGFGSGGGSILPYSGTDGIGGAYAQPSFGFGKKKRKRKVTKRKRKVDKKGQKLELKSIKKSTRDGKKFMATFIMPNGRTKTTHFGAAGMSDYTKHKDKARKQRYINRHKKRENWNDPTTAGALSLYILWNKPTLKASIVDYKKRFGFK